jgi:O-antigen/teichoic acid export membrane protein
VSAALLFVLYRFLLRHLGAEAVGIWSLVLATTSASRLADLGLSGSVVRFVAKYDALGDLNAVAEVIDTAAISLGTLLAGVLAVAYPLLNFAIELIVPASDVTQARLLLPYSLISLWVLAVGTVFQAGLEGSQRFALKNGIVVSTNLLYLLLVFAGVPLFGLLGLAYAQLIQAGAVLITTRIILGRAAKETTLIPRRWSKKRLIELISYGVKFQAASLANLFFDFTTKALLSRFGILADVAYYDMASRLVLQVRGIIISAGQVMIPRLVAVSETNPSDFNLLYRRTYDVLTYFAIAFFGSVICLAPLVSVLWLGGYNRVFVVYTYLLAVGWLLNSASAPAFFSNIAKGFLRWNIIGQLTIGIVNLILGILLGQRYGSTGVVSAWSIALVSGSVLVTITYHMHNNVPFAQLFPTQHWNLSLSVVLACALSSGLLAAQRSNGWDERALLFIPLVFAGFVARPLWKHPLRVTLMAGVRLAGREGVTQKPSLTEPSF